MSYSLALGPDLRVVAGAVMQFSLYTADKTAQVVCFQIWLTCELGAVCVILVGLREALFAERLRPETLLVRSNISDSRVLTVGQNIEHPPLCLR